jgi:hypothetical protein
MSKVQNQWTESATRAVASPTQWQDVQPILAEANRKLTALQSLEPFFIDLSLRENSVGSTIGQTLAEKIAIFPQLRAFGFQNILIGTLDYALPDEPEVDDDFMVYLRDNNIDRTGCYAFTDIGLLNDAGVFIPSPSQAKLPVYGVPNSLHEIYLSDAGMSGLYDIETLKRSVVASIAWCMANMTGDNGGPPKIIINVVDGCDAWAQNPERTFEVMQLLAQQPIYGVSLEDDRGTYIPFQVGAYVALARAALPSPLKLLVHMHAGGGFENASVIEALINGADGVWGGLPKRAAIIGHGSLGELIANLVRLGNTSMTQYQVPNLVPFANRLQNMDDNEANLPDTPMLGANAYRVTLDFFRQVPGRFMDLPPEVIGAQSGYRVCPLVSGPTVLAGRLSEVLGEPPSNFPTSVTEQMVRLMRRDLRAGNKIVYDDPTQLVALYQRALATKG